MAFVTGLGSDLDVIGALLVPRGLAPLKRRGKAAASLARLVSSARETFLRGSDLPRRQNSPIAVAKRRRGAGGAEEKEICGAFARIGEVVGLTEEEGAVLAGARELSDMILALETLGAALALFRAPHAVGGWLRQENPEEPFSDRSPLRLMADHGRLGIEIVLLYLRARLRVAQVDSEGADRFLL
jgi:hypothetical protein